MSATNAVAEEVVKVLQVITDLEARLAELRGLLAVKEKGKKKVKKVRDPNLPKREPNAWIRFTQRVEGVLRAAEKGFERCATSKQFCKVLKDKKPYAEWLDEEVLAERDEWEPPSPVQVIVDAADAATVAAANPCPVCKGDVAIENAQAHRECLVRFATEAEERGEDPMKAVDTWKEAVAPAPAPAPAPAAPPRRYSATSSMVKPLRALTPSRRSSSTSSALPTPIRILGPAIPILPGELVLEEFIDE